VLVSGQSFAMMEVAVKARKLPIEQVARSFIDEGGQWAALEQKGH
jgi:hypothetical protein